MLWLLAFACGGTPAPVAPPDPESCVTIPGPSHTPVAKRIASPALLGANEKQAVSTLRDSLQANALDPAIPWAVGHAIVGMGADLELTNGANAVDWLFSEYAVRIPIGDTHALAFPASKGTVRVEPHPSLMLKALIDAGVDATRSVTVDGHPHTVADLYRGTLHSMWMTPDSRSSSLGDDNDGAWALMAISSWTEPGTTWAAPTRDGAQCAAGTLSDFSTQLARALARDTAFIAEAQAKGGSFVKRRQGIFKYTCGGAHLIQGVLHAGLRGFPIPHDSASVHEQLTRLKFRFPIELAQIDAAMEANPKYRIPLAVQRLKLTGHTLETIGRIAVLEQHRTAWTNDLAPLIREVARSVRQLEALGVYKNLSVAKSENHQFFLDVIGDSAHALRGIHIATGVQAVYY
ncbi:MAG: hypothetical protein VX944_08635 [Myxococcota bacterium]|nr:hypothetical protein [Myxococcota bacterium]